MLGRWLSLSKLCIGYEGEVPCFYDYYRVGRLIEKLVTECVIVHYFHIESQDYFGTVGVPGGVLA